MLTRFGRFEVQASIGTGAMADVYRAFDPSISRVVAIKVLKRQYCEDRDYVSRFLREARAAGALSHPNIVTVFDVGEEAGHPYIAIELLDGEPLDQVLARRGRLNADEAISIGLQLAEALNYAHRLGVVHRDIKPSNIMLCGERAKILDFGIASLTEREGGDAAHAAMTQVGQIIGTPRYMSPEQVLGRALDGRSDLFSVGVLLYELLTGKYAFNGANPVTLALQITQQDPEPLELCAPETPRGLRFIIEKLLSKRPERRYTNGAQLAEALRREKSATTALRQEVRSARKMSLQARLALTMAFVTAAALLVSVGSVLHRQEDVLQDMALTSGATITSFIATNAALSAAENAALPEAQRDWLPVRAFVKSAGADPNILALRVVDKDGRIQASNRPEDVGQQYAPAASELSIRSAAGLVVTSAAEAKAFRFSRPINYAHHKVGEVEVLVSRADLEKAKVASRLLFAGLALSILGAVVAASYLMARALSLPVQRLRQAINDAAAGDFEFRISHSRRDEFGELFNAFNQLNAEVHDRLEAAAMEHRDRPIILPGQGPSLVSDATASSPAELDRTIIKAVG